ncbi:hypothetical protein MTO96_035762 [Rhipicephalus appendiculatus]
MAPKASLSRQACCVAGCSNSYASMASSDETIQFYRFPTRPWNVERRNIWVSAIRETRGDDWEPRHNTRICSCHFIGNRKSDDPRNPSYNPSIFPQGQRTPQIKPAVVSQPQLQRKRTRAPESRGRRRQLKKRKTCAFELQSAITNESAECNQPNASPGSPTIEIDGKTCAVETCEVGTMTSHEVREVGTMMPFKECDERRRLKRQHVGTMTYLQPEELPRRLFTFFCVSDGRNVSTQTWSKYVSMQSTQTDAAVLATVAPPHGRPLVVINNTSVRPDHKSVCLTGARVAVPEGCPIMTVSSLAVGSDKSVCSSGTQSEASESSTCGRPLVAVRNAAVGPDCRTVCFLGTQSAHKDDESMQSLCGMTGTTFALVMSIIPDNLRTFHDVSKADRLTLFLMKLKTGLTYGALAALFGLHRTTVARCFLGVLNSLFDKTRSWIEWQQSDDVRSKTPDYFKLHYPNCSIIIDTAGARVSQPAPVEIQDFYSSPKGTFSAKFLFGVAPNGALTFVRSAGDRGGFLDEFTAVASSVKPGSVLTDKSSAVSANSSRTNATLISPSSNRECSNSNEVGAVHSMYSVRMHVDRMIHRLKYFNILYLPLSADLHNNIDRIVHVICVLANLHGSVLKSSGSNA